VNLEYKKTAVRVIAPRCQHGHQAARMSTRPNARRRPATTTAPTPAPLTRRAGTQRAASP